MTRFEKWAVWSTSLGTTVTGLGFGWAKYLVSPTEPWAAVNHWSQPWWLKAHLLFAPGLVFAVGLIFMRHIWLHFRGRLRLGRRSGLATMLSVGPMVATGYLIQLVTHVGWLRAMAWSHIGFGIVYAIALALHLPAVRAPGGAPRERRTRAPGRRLRDRRAPGPADRTPAAVG